MNEPKNAKIGIIGGGFQGFGTAVWFALRDFEVVVCDNSSKQIEKINEQIENNKKKRRVLKRNITSTQEMEDLKECDLIIENVPENLELKRSIFGKLENIVSDTTILASNSSSIPPSKITEFIKKKERFINIHYLGVTFGNAVMEIIPGEETSEECYNYCKEVLERANFKPVKVKECPGFVFNRVTLVEVANLLRAVELGLNSIENTLKYLLFHQKDLPFASLDLIGLDIPNAAIQFLNSQLGDRYYISKILAEKVNAGECGEKTGKGFLDYIKNPQAVQDLVKSKKDQFSSTIKKVYIHDIQINYSNFVAALIQSKKELVFPSKDMAYFDLLKKTDESFYNKVMDNAAFTENGTIPGDCDAALYFPSIVGEETIIDTIKNIAGGFDGSKAIIVNLPIYKLADITEKSGAGDRLMGINCQKSFLRNTEIIKNRAADSGLYDNFKNFIGEVTGDVIEVNDGDARPLTFQIVSKMFETIRIIEEDVATIENVERLMVKDNVFREIDYLGVDNLVKIAEHCFPIYGPPFEIPELLKIKLKENNLGLKTGKGFKTYG